MAMVYLISLLLTGAILCQVIQSFLTWYSRRRLIVLKGCLPAPALPQQDPILGLDMMLKMLHLSSGNRRNVSLKAQLDEFGNTFTAQQWGGRRIFSIEPRNLQSIFSTDLESWGVAPLRRFVFEPLTGHGIMTSDGTAWEAHRAMLKSLFGKQQLMHADELEKHVSRLLELIPTDGRMVDMQPLFARQALDVSTEFLFGASTNSLTEKPGLDAKRFLDAYNYALAGVGKRMCLPFWNIFTTDKKWWQCCADVRTVVEKYVEREWVKQSQDAKGWTQAEDHAKGETEMQSDERNANLASSTSRRRFILAAELLRNAPNKAVVRDQLLNIFMPAHDADAIALTNLTFALARNPDVYAKVRHEVLAAFPLPSPTSSTEQQRKQQQQQEEEDVPIILPPPGMTIERVRALPYLHAVVRETMRLYPSIGTTSRIALADTTLPVGGGPDGKAPIFVRRGDVFSSSFYALHRRKDIWGPDADKFIPERWLEEDPSSLSSSSPPLSSSSPSSALPTSFPSSSSPTPSPSPSPSLRSAPQQYSFLPFIAGPRICPGQTFALSEVMYTMARIAQNFAAIENRDPVLEFVERYKITTESANGAKVAFVV